MGATKRKKTKRKRRRYRKKRQKTEKKKQNNLNTLDFLVLAYEFVILSMNIGRAVLLYSLTYFVVLFYIIVL